MSRTGKDIDSSILVATMYTTAITANPLPYLQTLQPARAAPCAARRTGYRRKCFVDFFVPRAFSNGFVREHRSKARPRCIKDRLCHLGFGKSGGVHIAYRDVIKLTHDAGAEFMVKIFATIRNLRMYCLDAAFLARPLRYGKSLFSAPVNALRFDLFARGKGGKVFQTQVDANTLDGLAQRRVCNFDNDIQEPVATSVTGKVRAVLDLAFWKGAAIEHPKRVASKSKRITLALEVLTPDRHPAERLLSAIAKIRALLLAARLGVLLTHGVDRSRVQTKFFTATSGKIVQIKASRPALTPFQGVLLRVIAKIEDIVYRAGLLVKKSRQRLDAVAVNLNAHFFKNSSMARRISSETGRPVSADIALSLAM